MKQTEDRVPRPKPLEVIEKITDGAERTIEAVKFMRYCDQQKRDGMALRNAGIRQMKAGKAKLDEIVERTGVSLGTVKAVLTARP